MASSVSIRTALALPVLRIDRFEIVIPTRSLSSFNDILRFAIITSRLIIIGIAQMVNSCSSFKLAPCLKASATMSTNSPLINNAKLKAELLIIVTGEANSAFSL